MRKLDVNDDVKSYLEKMRDIFAELSLSNEHLSKVVAGEPCGAYCMVTCAYWCRPSCEMQCKDSCDQTCKYTCNLASAAINCPQYIIWAI